MPCSHAAALPMIRPPEGMTSLRLPPSFMAGMPSPPRMPSSQPLITSCTPTWGSMGGSTAGEHDEGLKLALQQATGGATWAKQRAYSTIAAAVHACRCPSCEHLQSGSRWGSWQPLVTCKLARFCTARACTARHRQAWLAAHLEAQGLATLIARVKHCVVAGQAASVVAPA